MRSFVLALLVLAPLPSLAGESLRSLTVDEVQARLGKPNVYVFDVNSLTIYKQGHLPGAKWAMYDRIDESVLPADKTATLIFYCANEH